MSDSDRYEALMLEHLYGLLEPDEARELQAYLATPDGADLRARAEVWRDKLTGAAKAPFDNVRFVPPAPTAPREPTPASTGRMPMRAVWTRWAVAASLLLVLGGLGGPAAYQFVGWYAQSRETDGLRVAVNEQHDVLRKLEADQHARREAVRKEHAEAVAAHQSAQKAYQDALASAHQTIEQKDFNVRLTGPDRIQPGAPNAWTIETLDRQGRSTLPRKMDVVVRDQKDTELLRETHDHPVRPAALHLPASFWAKVQPGSDLFVEVVAYTDDNRSSTLSERLPLARPVYITHLVTDKPLYRPGETVRFRSLTLDRATFRPPAHDQHLKFRLIKPDGAGIDLDDANGRVMAGLKPVVGPDGKPVRGIGTGEYELPGDFPGGEYTLEVVEVAAVGVEKTLDTRKFIVASYTVDVFEKRLEFDGKSYGPGDYVQARVEVSRTAGGPMKDARADVKAAIGEHEFFVEKDRRFEVVADPNSRQSKNVVLSVRFKLPAELFANRNPQDKPPTATLAVTIRDGTDAEVIVRPIPIVEKDLVVEFFPEGGELVAGVPGRVYFQVRTPSGKPADLTGIITDGKETIAEIATLTDAERAGVNRGQGLFNFTPKAGTRYSLKLKTPAGIKEPTKDGYPLPDVKADGVVLTALDAVTEKGQPIRVSVQSAKARTLHVGAYARGRLIGHQRVEVEAGKPAEVQLRGDEALGGVTRITVFEEPKVDAGKRANLIPRAERLVYRKPGEQLLLSVNPDKMRYSPSGKVSLDIGALTEKEQPTPAILLVGVVNQSVIAMADNKTDRLLPAHFLLAGEVRNPADLEHADFLLTDHPKAAVALDLLLGTQGWRRFAEQNVVPASPIDRDEVERMLVSHGQRTTAPVERYRLEEQRVTAEFLPKVEQASQRLGDAVKTGEQFRTQEEPAFRQRESSAQSQLTAAESRHTDAAAELYRFETRTGQLRSWALPLFLLGLLVLTAGGIAFAVTQPRAKRRTFVVSAGGALAMASLVLVAVVLTHGTREAEVAFAAAQERERMSVAGSVRPNRAPGVARPPGAPPMVKDFAPARGVPDPLPPGPKVEQKDPGEIVDQHADPKWDNKGLRRRPGVADAHKNEAAHAEAANRPAPGAVAQLQGAAFPSSIVREYAHFRDPSLGAVRSDFTETVYWHPVLVLPDNGRTKVEFQLSDDIARYQVLVAGHTTDGRIGAVTKTIEARKPFTVDPKLPLEVNSGDVIDVPVRVTNDSDDRRTIGFTLTPSNLDVIDGGALKTAEGLIKDSIDLLPNGKGRKVFRLKPQCVSGQATLTVVGNSEPAAEPDAVARIVTVVPEGFPGVGSFSDLLEKRAIGTVELPKDLVKGSLKVRLEVYPTSMADLVKGLDGLLREPGGCFEQSSTANYPNTLILDYLNQTNQANPEASRRAKEMLDRGYGRITSFECPDTPAKIRQGFEWFGAADLAHEALTAYGLLQFKDMARVHAVDPELIRRTQAFLLSRRDGRGGFQRNARALDTFGGAPKHTTDAYIVWALVESDPDDAEKLDLAKEIAALKAEALKDDSTGGKDAYFVALTANVLLQRGDRETALGLLDRLKDKNVKDGAVTGAQTSITRSGGRDLEIETTALALLGWLRANDTRYAATVKDATRWISRQRGGYGGFGSTQSTILALKALILHAKKNAHPAESGEIRLLVNGKPVATRRFSEKDVEVIGLEIDKPEDSFVAGAKSDVEVVTDAKHPYPFALSYAYTTLTPASAERCALKLETKLGRVEVNEGETVPLTVTLENRRKEGQGMAMAIVGLPAGLKVPADMKQLADLREKGVISFFETRGRELILYWRELAPEQKVTLAVELACDVPGEYRGPASRAYLYYNADHKHWAEPVAIKIRPMAPENEVVDRR